MPALLAWADNDESSAWVKIGDGEKQTNLAQDDIVDEGQTIDGKCQIPDMKIGIGGDLRSIRVGPDPDTCQIVVKSIVARPTD